MTLVVKWGRSPWWYGRYMRDGRKLSVKLDVRVEGTPPASKRLSDKGDPAFEKSRAQAELRFTQVQEEMQGSHSKEDLLKRIVAIRQGGKMPTVLLSDAYEVWRKLPRKGPMAERYEAQVKRRWEIFTSFVAKHQPRAKTLADVSVETAEVFVNTERDKGGAPKTSNSLVTLLRSIFGQLRTKASLPLNPFGDIPLLDDDPMGQMPYTPEELARIVAAAQKPEHAYIRPILFTAICTAMRRGDCCKLEWRNVDIENRIIEVRTSKGKKTAFIPMFPLLLEEVLRHQPATDKYVFPAQARLYMGNPDRITDLADKVLQDSGFTANDKGPHGAMAPSASLRSVRAHGLRKVRQHGMHSFRVTWVTLALTAGVPIEVVRLVTSHQSVAIVLKHYFKPGREAMRRILNDKMPRLFFLTAESAAAAGTSAAPKPDEMRALVESMTSENWQIIRGELLQRLEPKPVHPIIELGNSAVCR